jgi:hypothetical protein
MGYSGGMTETFHLYSATGDAWFGGTLGATNIQVTPVNATYGIWAGITVGGHVSISATYYVEAGHLYQAFVQVWSVRDDDGVTPQDNFGIFLTGYDSYNTTVGRQTTEGSGIHVKACNLFWYTGRSTGPLGAGVINITVENLSSIVSSMSANITFTKIM